MKEMAKSTDLFDFAVNLMKSSARLTNDAYWKDVKEDRHFDDYWTSKEEEFDDEENRFN